MFNNQNKAVGQHDHFYPADYPKLEGSLSVIDDMSANLPRAHKAEMLISFVKDHSMRTLSMQENPQFAELVLSHSLPLKDLEELFARCKGQIVFSKELQTYIQSFFTSRENKPLLPTKTSI